MSDDAAAPDTTASTGTGTDQPPRVVLDYPVFDTRDPARDARFWADLLHGVVSRDEEDWYEVTYAGGVRLCFQLAPDHKPSGWPHGQQQMHLDFVVDADEVHRAHEHAVAVGATLLHPTDGPPAEVGGSGFLAYADPSGHPFCLCWRQ